jgi:hypothetical protein
MSAIRSAGSNFASKHRLQDTCDKAMVHGQPIAGMRGGFAAAPSFYRPFKFHEAERHHAPKAQHRVRNIERAATLAR